MILTVKTEPTIEPVTVAELKTYLKIDTTEDDTLIDSLEKSARRVIEDYCNRVFITQTLLQTHSDGEEIIRLRLPLQSITSVKIFDEKEIETILILNTDYYKNTPLGELRRVNGHWPISPEYVQIEYTAGYGSSATSVPEGIKTAIKQFVAELYENRGEDTEATIENIPASIKKILAPYRILRTL